MERVIVLMSTYNGEQYLREQMDSILNQDYPNFMIVVADDGSKDNTFLLLSAYANAHPDKITVRANPENRGATLSFLHLLQDTVAEGNEEEKVYYMFADQDDIWHSDKISRTLKRMKGVEKKAGEKVPALVYSDAVVMDDDKNVISDSFGKLQHLNIHDHSLNHLLMENACQGCTMMMNRALGAMIALPKQPEVVRFHDWWVALTATTFGNISFVQTPTMDYRQHASNVVGAEKYTDYVKKRVAAKEEAKEALERTYRQGKAFYELFGEKVTQEQKRELLEAFAKLSGASKAKRLRLIVKYRFFKSGAARNAGLMLLQ